MQQRTREHVRCEQRAVRQEGGAEGGEHLREQRARRAPKREARARAQELQRRRSQPQPPPARLPQQRVRASMAARGARSDAVCAVGRAVGRAVALRMAAR